MAGEYYRWLARDVKPEEKREMTREEKWKNRWDYHKWHLLIAAVVLFLVLDLVSDILADYRNQPDYSIAYVGSSYLPEDTVAQLTAALALWGEDLNGRGGTQVALHQYLIYPPETADAPAAPANDPALYYAQVQLAADIENCDSFFFLMEDPERFQNDYQLLVRPDGSAPDAGAGGSGPLYYAWSDCPELKELPLGEFRVETMSSVYTGSSQEVLSSLYIGRRGFWQEKTCSHPEGCEALWSELTQGTGQ